MTQKTAVGMLWALAQDSRLGVFRLLVKAGSGGLPQGRIAVRLKLSPPTLSFHLRALSAARLLKARREGRFIYYSPDLDSLSSLLAYLTPSRSTGSPSSENASSSNS